MPDTLDKAAGERQDVQAASSSESGDHAADKHVEETKVDSDTLSKSNNNEEKKSNNNNNNDNSNNVNVDGGNSTGNPRSGAIFNESVESDLELKLDESSEMEVDQPSSVIDPTGKSEIQTSASPQLSNADSPGHVQEGAPPENHNDAHPSISSTAEVASEPVTISAESTGGEATTSTAKIQNTSDLPTTTNEQVVDTNNDNNRATEITDKIGESTQSAEPTSSSTARSTSPEIGERVEASIESSMSQAANEDIVTIVVMEKDDDEAAGGDGKRDEAEKSGAPVTNAQSVADSDSSSNSREAENAESSFLILGSDQSSGESGGENTGDDNDKVCIVVACRDEVILHM